MSLWTQHNQIEVFSPKFGVFKIQQIYRRVYDRKEEKDFLKKEGSQTRNIGTSSVHIV